MPTINAYIPDRVYQTWIQWLGAWRNEFGDPEATVGEVLQAVVRDKKFWPKEKGR